MKPKNFPGRKLLRRNAAAGLLTSVETFETARAIRTKKYRASRPPKNTGL